MGGETAFTCNRIVHKAHLVTTVSDGGVTSDENPRNQCRLAPRLKTLAEHPMQAVQASPHRRRRSYKSKPNAGNPGFRYSAILQRKLQILCVGFTGRRTAKNKLLCATGMLGGLPMAPAHFRLLATCSTRR